MISFFLIVVLLLGGAGALYWRWRKKVDEEIVEGAAIEWAHLSKHEPELVAHLDEASFNDIYKRVNEPRFPGYAFAAVATFFLSLPLIFTIILGLHMAAGAMGLVPEPLELVRYVNLGEPRPAQSWQCNQECQLYIAEAFSGFYYFFGVLFSWLLIVAFFMRRYHQRRPGYLRDEIIRTKE